MNQALRMAHDRAIDILEDGAGDPHSPWRNFALATVAVGGVPRVRTIVLRDFDARSRTLSLHTDGRSAKLAELRANPAAALHAWNPASGEQIRAEGIIAVHGQDPTARAAWDGLGSRTRDTYRVTQPPGLAIENPDVPVRSLADEEAFRHFTVLSLNVARLEYLLIAENGHRRALFTWEDGVANAMWLVP